MSHSIEINNSQPHLAIDEDFLRTVATRVLAEEQVAEATLSIAVVDNATIHRLNRTFLKHDEATDVLSFLLECTPPAGSSGEAAGPRGAGKQIEGEIVLSAEMAAHSAAEFRWTPHEELVLYLVHGLLHLVGYDDLSAGERRQMRERERALLAHWGLEPHYWRSSTPADDRPRPLPVDGSSGEFS